MWKLINNEFIYFIKKTLYNYNKIHKIEFNFIEFLFIKYQIILIFFFFF